MFKKIFPSRILHLIIITFLITFFLSKKTNAQYDISAKINETEINNVLNALVEAHGINFGKYEGGGLVAWYVNVDAASVNIQPNNVIILNVNLVLVAEIDVFIFEFPAVDHQQLSISGHFEIEGNLQTGYNLVFVHDPISVSFYGVEINEFPDNIKINLGSSILPESISTLFTSGIPQINTNDNEIIFGFNFQGPRFFIFKNNFMEVSNGGIINIDGTQYYSPTSVEVVSGNSVTATAIDQTILGISYVFTSWSNGSTSRTTTLSQEGTYTANFVRTFSVSISGPTTIGWGVDATWNASTTGGNPPYHYQWWYKYPGGIEALNISSEKKKKKKKKISVDDTVRTELAPIGYWTQMQIDSPTLTRHDYLDHYLKCVVTDADNTTVTSNIMYIYVNGSSSPPFPPLAKNDLQQNNLDKSISEKKVTENSLGNYPNPFNPSTIIRYQIVKAGQVTLKVYDTLGREVANLVDKQQPSGQYSVNFNASKLSSGIYLYRITANGFTAVKKMILTK